MHDLLIDLGNTALKAVLHGGQRSAVFELPHQDESLNAGMDDFLASRGAGRAVIASVARPVLGEQLEAALAAADIAAEWLISPAEGLGIRCAYANPKKWGVDRWLALAAGHARAGGACCVIDIGTATTVDLCDSTGRHLGGLIAPGPVATARALRHETALPSAAAELPESLGWADDTERALQWGALHTSCGLIERCARLARKQHGCDTVFLTGGGADHLARHLDIACQRAPNLVLEGLALYATRGDGSTAPSL